jgi:mRNA-degrading endonuclease RelE of RelBE toxin-antitoxin system
VAEIRLSRRAVNDLDALPKRTAARVLGVLERLAEDPTSDRLDVKGLAGRRPWRRLRVGDYRILFKPVDRGRILLVARIIDRKELDRAVAGLPE